MSAPASAFEARAFNGSRCIAGRFALRNRCFAGGNPDDPDDKGHLTAIAQAAIRRALCLCLADIARLPGLSAAEFNNARSFCRRRFRSDE